MSQKSILDAFTRIKNNSDAAVADLCINLINHLFRYGQHSEDENPDGVPKEITYTLKRLIQGLGSPKSCVRTCYFSSLSVLLSSLHYVFNGQIGLDYLNQIVHLRLSKFDSKGEEGEVLVGRILAYGASIRSGVFMKAPIELQQEIFKWLLEHAQDKSYLPLLVFTFIFEYIDKVEKQTFKSVLWSILKNQLHGNLEQETFESFACALKVYQMYPSLLKKMPILKNLRNPDSYDINGIFNMLTNISSARQLQHPVYDAFAHYVISHDNKRNLLNEFWNKNVDVVLKNKKRMQFQAILKLFHLFASRVDFDMVDSLLTSSLVYSFLECCSVHNAMTDDVKYTIQSLLERCVEEGKAYPLIIFNILCKFTLDVECIFVDKKIGLKIIAPLVSELDEEHVMILGDRLQEIIMCEHNGKWSTSSKRYAVHLLARLFSHPKLQNADWKIKILRFLFKYSLFQSTEKNVHISNEIAGVMKSSIFSSMNHRIPNVHAFRKLLMDLVQHLDKMLRVKSNQLRFKHEILASWNQYVLKANKIDAEVDKLEEKRDIIAVFHVLFLQMTLYLFFDDAIAKDALLELDRCYERVKRSQTKRSSSQIKKNNKIDEPTWIEVIVELFLSWLSRDTSYFRLLIGRIFPYLCPELTAQNMYQILQVLDPNNNHDLLSSDEKSDNAEVNNSAIESDDRRGNNNQEEEEEETDTDIENDEDDIEETAMDKMRAAVHQALGICGNVTDTESLDLDDIDEQEGKRLDDALSAAFKSFDKHKTNKEPQSADEKILTNFRIRVLDLIEIILDNNPPLTSVLEIIPVSFSLLELCVKNHHQKPLEQRIRAVLRKVGALKKYSGLEDVNNQLIVTSLNNLLEKGTRTNAVLQDVNSHISECCIFLIRAFYSKRISNVDLLPKNVYDESVDALLRVWESAFDQFFCRRDYALPSTLFDDLLTKVPTKDNIRFYYKFVDYAFDPSVRLFKRQQALSFLLSLYKKTNVLSIFSDDEIEVLEKRLSSKINQLSNDECSTIKESFLTALFTLLHTIKIRKNGRSVMKWNNVIVFLKKLPETSSLNSQSVRKAYRRLCSALDVPIGNIDRHHNLGGKVRNGESTSSRYNGIVAINDDQLDDGLNASDKDDSSSGVENRRNLLKRGRNRHAEKLNAKKIRIELENDLDTFEFSKISERNENL